MNIRNRMRLGGLVLVGIVFLSSYYVAAWASCDTLQCDEVICHGIVVPFLGTYCTSYSQTYAINCRSPGPEGGQPVDIADTVDKRIGCGTGCTLGCSGDLILREAICGTGCGDPTTITRQECVE